MITLQQYWMGRDESHTAELTQQIRLNALRTVDTVNRLLALAKLDDVEPGLDRDTGTPVASGWRPAGVNAATKNAASASRHLTAQACDLRDTKGRELARWCLSHEWALEEIGVWMEDPRWTPTWVHWQWLPPGSGRRVYVPSTAAPLAPPLPEQR